MTLQWVLFEFLMKISIITVCFNSGSTIRETIESVLSQVISEDDIIEYILIDGNSTDNTLSIIREYNERISYIVSEEDKGIYDAMNKGIRLASGEIVGILNSDDLFDNDTVISEVAQAFNFNHGIDAVYGDIFYFKTKSPDKSIRFWKSKPYYLTFFDDGYVIPHPALFVRKMVYDSVGLYYPNFKISSDYEWMLRAFKIHKFSPFYLKKVLVKMRMGGESTKNWKNIVIGNIEVYRSWRMNGIPLPLLFYLRRIIFKVRQLISELPQRD